MLLKAAIQDIISHQNAQVQQFQRGIEREMLAGFSPVKTHVRIITGVRRCGKSTLMRQILNKFGSGNFVFINFEDPRFSSFEPSDHIKLIQVLEENYTGSIYFFDEIQNLPEWHKFVRIVHDKRKEIYITGSNAAMLSGEFGTKLTGRHLSSVLFPFSYKEYLVYTNQKPGETSFQQYAKFGGFPDFLANQNEEILQQLFNDIVIRDIVVRYGIKDERLIKELGVYLLSNVGKEFSFNKLKNLFSIGSANSVSNYIGYFESTYLFFTVPRYSYSLKQQVVNPKKIYAIDNGMIKANSLSFSDDLGRMLENLVYLELRRKGYEIYYFNESGECDFIYKRLNKTEGAIQVCYQLTADNQKREINGLLAALNFSGLKEGLILTFNEEDNLQIEGKNITIMPVWKWMD
jgi:predicted AAA+ superfamily ATPase